MVFIHFCSQLRRKNILSFLAVKTMQSLKFTNTSSHQQTLVHYFSKVLPSSALHKDRKHDTNFPCSHPGRVTAREYCHFQGILKLQASLQNRAFGLLAIPHLPDRSVQGFVSTDRDVNNSSSHIPPFSSTVAHRVVLLGSTPAHHSPQTPVGLGFGFPYAKKE